MYINHHIMMQLATDRINELRADAVPGRTDGGSWLRLGGSSSGENPLRRSPGCALTPPSSHLAAPISTEHEIAIAPCGEPAASTLDRKSVDAALSMTSRLRRFGSRIVGLCSRPPDLSRLRAWRSAT